MPKKSSPEAGLAPRACLICGASFQPYRAFHLTCSRYCRERLPAMQERKRVYYKREDVRARKNAARSVANNPARRDINLRQQVRRYGITYDEYVAMRDAQCNRCKVCHREPDPDGIKSASRLHVDHDHVTGKNRGLLCNRCNPGVGYFQDDPSLLRAAAEYIENHRLKE